MRNPWGHVIGALLCSVLFLVVAGVLYGVAEFNASGSDCPRDSMTRSATGFDLPRSTWPPGVECDEGDGSGVQVVQTSSALTILIALFLALAAVGPLAVCGALAIGARRAPSRSPGPISGA